MWTVTDYWVSTQTLYGIDMFDFEVPGQTTQFAVTTSVVSVATYLAALGLLYGVRRRRKKGSYRGVWGELIRDAAITIGHAAKSSPFKRAFGVQTGPVVDEYDAQEGIPENLKGIFFTDMEQHTGASEKQQPQGWLKYDRWMRDRLRGRGVGHGTSAA